MTTYGRWTAHPTAERLPLIQDDDFDKLVASIQENGQRESVTIWKNQILDGRNRVRACEKIGIKVKWVEWDEVGSPIDFIIDQNLRRRHLSEPQLRLLGLVLQEEFQAEAKERQRLGQDLGREHRKMVRGLSTANQKDDRKGRAMNLAARAVGQSTTALTRTKHLAKNRPDLLAKVNGGELLLTNAYFLARQEAGAAIRRASPVVATPKKSGSTRWGRGYRATIPSRALARALVSIEGLLMLLEPMAGQFTNAERESIKPFISRLRKLTQPKEIKSVSEN